MDENEIAMDWIEWASDVAEDAMWDTEPTLLQLFALTEHGHFPGQED